MGTACIRMNHPRQEERKGSRKKLERGKPDSLPQYLQQPWLGQVGASIWKQPRAPICMAGPFGPLLLTSQGVH